MWFLLIKKARWLKLFVQNNELFYFCSVIKQINKNKMKQILGVIVHLIGYVLLLGMFAVALISVVFDKPVHPHGIEP